MPALRGREKDRRPGEILAEIEALVADGVLEVTLDVIAAMAETPNVMPHLHMPLQSGSDRPRPRRDPGRRDHHRHHRRLPRRDRRRLRGDAGRGAAGAVRGGVHLPVLDAAGNGRTPPADPDGRGPLRPGDLAVVTVTHAARHHLLADSPVLRVRRTRAGDAWQDRQAGRRTAPATVGLGRTIPVRAR